MSTIGAFDQPTRVSRNSGGKRKVITIKRRSKEAAPPTHSPSFISKPTAPKSSEVPYWFDPRIHVWGNVGWKGRVHALLAPFATALIDHLSYDGLDVRKVAHQTIKEEYSVLDLCCGTGYSTLPGSHGVDTSQEMLDVAKFVHDDSSFSVGNAESYGQAEEYDVVTIMFALHEMPADARRRVLRNAMRIASKSVILVDIHPDFHQVLAAKPMQGASFLMGEPYVLDYLENLDSDGMLAAHTMMQTPSIAISSSCEYCLRYRFTRWQLNHSWRSRSLQVVVVGPQSA